MPNCCVPFCPSYCGKQPRISYHEFPSDPLRRQRWEAAIHRGDDQDPRRPWHSKERSFVCGLHFTNSDYVPNLKVRKLKRDAVPSVFDSYATLLGVKGSYKKKLPLENSKGVELKERTVEVNVKTEIQMDQEEEEETPGFFNSLQSLKPEDSIKVELADTSEQAQVNNFLSTLNEQSVQKHTVKSEALQEKIPESTTFTTDIETVNLKQEVTCTQSSDMNLNNESILIHETALKTMSFSTNASELHESESEPQKICSKIDSMQTSIEKHLQTVNDQKSEIESLQKQLSELKESNSILEAKAKDKVFNSCLKNIFQHAKQRDVLATFIMEQTNTFNKPEHQWSELTLQHCATWMEKCPEDYEYVQKSGLVTLPCRSLLVKFYRKLKVTK